MEALPEAARVVAIEQGAPTDPTGLAAESGAVSSHPAAAGQVPSERKLLQPLGQATVGKGTPVPGAAAWGSLALSLLVLNFLFCLLPVRF